jgi:hypothetical protein
MNLNVEVMHGPPVVHVALQHPLFTAADTTALFLDMIRKNFLVLDLRKEHESPPARLAERNGIVAVGRKRAGLRRIPLTTVLKLVYTTRT